jgi:hypothetical protein
MWHRLKPNLGASKSKPPRHLLKIVGGAPKLCRGSWQRRRLARAAGLVNAYMKRAEYY